jgi:hypothetical protein
MPTQRPGPRRCAPGDKKGNDLLNREHEALLQRLKERATQEWEQKGGKRKASGEGAERGKAAEPTRRRSERLRAKTPSK